MNEKAQWYVLHTNTGYENVAKENLERVIEKNNLQDRIFDIVIPMEDVLEEKNGKKVLVQRKLMPTYLLVKMIYGDDIWHRVVGTKGITGFVGPKGRAIPLTEQEIVAMRLDIKQTKVDFNVAVGDSVEILDGPLNGVIGKVSEVNEQAQSVKVVVDLFGRETPVDVSLNALRKVEI